MTDGWKNMTGRMSENRIRTSGFRRGAAVLLTLCMLLACVLSGCSAKAGEDQPEGKKTGNYRIYYMNADGTQLQYEHYKPESQDFEGILKELLTQFCTSPKEKEITALPDSVKINSTAIGISEIGVDFSSGYLSLSKPQELLLRAALVETLVQLPGVDTVRFTVEGQPLTLNGAEVGAMNKDTFIVPDGDAINSYRTLELPLYFSSQDGRKLVKENRKIYYSSNINTERIVAEQIISGPKDDSLLPVTGSSVIVLAARIKGDTCLIDFSSAVNDLPAADSPVQPETAIYAFVNAICEACADEGVNGVRFTIEGRSDKRFRGQVNLDQTFTPDADIVEQAGSGEEAGVLVDTSRQEASSEAATEG